MNRAGLVITPLKKLQKRSQTVEVYLTLEKLHDPLFTKNALKELHRLFPNSWFAFHPASGLIVWWPHHSFHPLPMPLAIDHAASTIYHFDQDSCHIVKDRYGMNFATPKEVNILQALLS